MRRNRTLDKYRDTSEDVTASIQMTVTPTHVRVVEFLDELMSTMLGENTTLSPVVKILHRMRPAIMRDLSSIPEDQLTSFLTDLGSRMIRAAGKHVLVTEGGDDEWNSNSFNDSSLSSPSVTDVGTGLPLPTAVDMENTISMESIVVHIE